jgi:hypothetical protein
MGADSPVRIAPFSVHVLDCVSLFLHRRNGGVGEESEIFSWTVRLQALKRAVLAEVVVLLVAPLMLFFWMKREKENYLSYRVLLEQQTPLVEMRDPGQRPHLPLSIDAVGFEAPDGRFTSAMFLIWPQAGWNFEKI